mgnify:CR=1 FL=1
MRPTLRSVLVFLAGVPLALGAAIVHPRLWTLWLGYLAAAVLLVGLDAVLGVRRRSLRVTVVAPEQVYIGEGGQATIQLAAGRRAAEVEVLAELDPELAPAAVARVAVRASAPGAPARGELALAIAPRRRGSYAIVAIHARWTGPLGLLERQRAFPIDRRIAVVPNLGAVRAVALRAFSDRAYLAGLKVEKFLGDGSEFEALREYVPGMDHRAIDWKSSARHRKLLCQEFRAERNHQVVLAIDGGQLMAEPLAGAPRLDHAINAALLLAWFCLRTGDRVGLCGFDERVRQWSEPAGGVHAFHRVQALTAEVAYRPVETNYTLCLAELATRVRRRSLVVLFTEFLDTVTAELMIENVTQLARRHLVVFVALRDPAVEARAASAPRSLGGLHEAVVAGDFARERHLVLERLRRVGAHCVDATPERFSMALVNRYLELKRRELF